MPIFKGFEKDADALVAVVDFPDAKKHTPYFQADGSIHTHVTPIPHEERLDEAAFKAKFAGLDFSAIRALPFSETGHDLQPLVRERLQAQQPNTAASNYSIKPNSGL
ncbi:MAG: hypothetical protein ACXW4B_08870 [Micavibrio sp.]